MVAKIFTAVMRMFCKPKKNKEGNSSVSTTTKIWAEKI